MKYLLLPFIVIILSCSDQNVTPVSFTIGSLEGKWIETKSRQDTIIFDSKLYSSDRTMFSFRSANEIGGYNMLHSTIYEFRIEGNKIFLYNLVSSCYCFKEYSFAVKSDNKIYIGNFYNTKTQGKIETFEKLK